VAVISPLVRRIAKEHGVDLRSLAGSGPDGLILRADVERAVTAQAPAPVSVSAAVPDGSRIPLRGVRGAVADKLSRSRREIPDATCWVDADATELLAARAAMNAGAAAKVSLLALLARICTAALARFPELNSTVDVERNEIVRLPAVHLGFAAQTQRGLVVPVVRDAQARTVEGLSEEIGRLTEAARTGSLSPAELTGGTFTLNNYGVFGVDGSTPIINHPEAAMLGVGRIAAKPWVVQGELVVRQVVQLSLTFDHRVCDGGAAGGFLRFVADCVERPAVLLRSV
jgi:pyruvate dehydrogenase E2 component (dihydrolipoamide acetyltransferase)